jgi:hypothetical protein
MSKSTGAHSSIEPLFYRFSPFLFSFKYRNTGKLPFQSPQLVLRKRVCKAESNELYGIAGIAMRQISPRTPPFESTGRAHIHIKTEV